MLVNRLMEYSMDLHNGSLPIYPSYCISSSFFVLTLWLLSKSDTQGPNVNPNADIGHLVMLNTHIKQRSNAKI